MIKKDLLETEVRTVGFQKVQQDLVESAKRVDEYRDSLKKLEHEKAKLVSAGQKESKEYKNLDAEASKLRKSIQEEIAAGKEKLDTLHFTELSYKQVKQRVAELTKEMKGMSQAADPAAYAQAQELLARYEAQLEKIQVGMKKTTGVVTKAPGMWANAFKQVKNFLPSIGIGGAAIKVFGQVSDFFRGAAPAFREYDEALTDAMKTTNQSKESMKQIGAELAKIDTRTSQNELLDLARVAGKLGIDTPKEIEGFVKASDKIGVALSEDLGGNVEVAITEVGKLVDIFKLKDQYGIEESMIRVGSAINEAGAASTANEGYIVDFAKRVAGIAPAANISLQNTIGLAATLDQFGQQSETSSTAIGQVITKMFLDPAKFAKLAKTEVKGFTELLNTDANAAFIQLLKGLKGNNEGMSEIVNNLDDMSVRGARGIQVMGSLVDNIETLEKQQALANKAFADGTSILDEFAKKNTSAEAEAAKIKKQFVEQSVILGEKLNPIVNSASTGLLYFTKVIVAFTGFLIESKGEIITLVAGYVLWNTHKKIAIFYSKAHGIEIRKEVAGVLLHDRAIKQGTATNAAYTLGQRALIAVKALLTGQFKAAGIAAKSFGVALKTALGSIGWVTIGITTIITAFSFFGKETKKASGSLGEMYSQIRQEKSTLDELWASVQNGAVGSKERAAAIKLINDQYGEYLPSLLNEKSTNVEIARAISKVNAALSENIRLKYYQEQKAAIMQTQFDAEKTALQEMVNMYENTGGRTEQQVMLFANRVSDIYSKALGGQLIEAYADMDTLMTDFGTRWQKGATDNVSSVIRAAVAARKEIAKLTPLAPKSSGGNKPVAICEKCKKDPCVCKKGGDGDDKKAWSLDGDAKFAEARRELKRKLRDGEYADEEDYSADILALEISTLEARIAAGKEKGDELLKLKDQLLDKQVSKEKDARKRKEALVKAAQGGDDEFQKAEREYDERQKALGLFNKKTEDMTAEDKAAKLQLEKEYNAKLSMIHLTQINKSVDDQRKEIERKLTTMRLAQSDELAQADTLEKKKLLLKRWFSDEELKLVTSTKEADRLLKAKYSEDQQAYVKEELSKLLQAYQEMAAQIDSTGSLLGSTVKFTEEDVKKLKDIIDKLREELAKQGLNPVVEIDTQDKSKNKDKVDVFGMSPDDWKKTFKNLEQSKGGLEAWGAVVAAVGQAVGQAFTEVSNLMTAIEQRELKSYEKTQNQKKKALEKQLNSGAISQEAYNSRIQMLDEQTEAKREEAERKQAERQKAMAIFQVLLNTASAIIATIIGAGGFPAAIPFVAAVAALGAIQLAAVIAQPLPGAEQGGMLVERTQDGRRFNAEFEPQKRGRISQPTVIVGENGSEYVVPAEGYDNPTIRPVLDLLESARLKGRLRSLDLPAAMQRSMMQGRVNGGYVDANVVSPTSAAPSNGSSDLAVVKVLEKNMQVIEKLSARLDKPIPAEVVMTGDRGLAKQYDKYNKIRDRAVIGRKRS